MYFSALTAYALVAYQWKGRKTFFTVIMCVMMIPAQVTSIGFYQFMYQIHMTNNFLALILPSIAAPATVFFMRQFMLSSLPLELLAQPFTRPRATPAMMYLDRAKYTMNRGRIVRVRPK